MSKQIIAIGTTSKLKIFAAERALSACGIHAEIRAWRSSSLVPEQPYGLDETRRGALQRALEAFRNTEGAAFGIGIENGLIPVGAGHIDLAFVAVVNEPRASSAIITTSVGLPIPEEFAVKSLQTDRTETAGKFYAEAVGCANDDWHVFATAGHVTRGDALEQAIRAAFAMTRRR